MMIVLSEHERAMLRFMADGSSYDEMSDALCYAPGSLKRHAGTLYAKFGGTCSRPFAVATALRLGVIE